MTETDRLKLAFEIALKVAAPDSGQHNPVLQGVFKEKFIFHFNSAYDAVKDCETKQFKAPAQGSGATSEKG